MCIQLHNQFMYIYVLICTLACTQCLLPGVCVWCAALSYCYFCARNHDKSPKLFHHGKMLLLMSWPKPQEKLTLGSKLSEKFLMSKCNFVQYIGSTYMHYGILQQRIISQSMVFFCI